ncbi:hypothetical protein AB4Z52_06970 [Rhizobium sp. 2YAF20]|uniref:hypothetical protein n=1 Tax=Rhizobium sp. 2YAF20 TaxID=3233027 RepID=UPI003F94E30B
MNPQARKNIRQAFPSIVHGSREWEVTQAAAEWVNVATVATIDQTLADLGLLEIAHSALVAGLPLEDCGQAGPYGTASQQRAWAAGRLVAACDAIWFAGRLAMERDLAVRKIQRLERQAELLRAETRAAARFKDIKVPFRKPRVGSVDWGADA